MAFKKAVKSEAKLRLALTGPSGSGKTYSALAIASGLSDKVALLDTEHKSASKYADEFNFDADSLDSFSPDAYVRKIKEAEEAGYEVLIIDSLSHAWNGKGGALELVDQEAARSKSSNTFQAWKNITPLQNKLIEAILSSKMHIIATMRAKTEYIVEPIKNKKGETVMAPKKIGLAPIQRDGVEYEFDITADMDYENNMIISKTRCSSLKDEIINKPGKQVSDILNEWLKGDIRYLSKDKASEIYRHAVAGAGKWTVTDLQQLFAYFGGLDENGDPKSELVPAEHYDEMMQIVKAAIPPNISAFSWSKKAIQKTASYDKKMAESFEATIPTPEPDEALLTK